MQEFYEREAVAKSLHAFYANLFFDDGLPKVEALIPSLLVLYDIMNDDDPEIRDSGAATVSYLFKKSLVPLKAQGLLVEWLVTNFGHSELLRWNILSRATGTLDMEDSELGIPSKLAFSCNILELTLASEHFLMATGQSDELFAVESQNLYEDPIREAKIWATAWTKLLPPSTKCGAREVFCNTFCNALWVESALESLWNYLDDQRKDRLWLKPVEYIACFRVLVVTHSFLVCYEAYKQGNTITSCIMSYQPAGKVLTSRRFSR